MNCWVCVPAKGFQFEMLTNIVTTKHNMSIGHRPVVSHQFSNPCPSEDNWGFKKKGVSPQSLSMFNILEADNWMLFMSLAQNNVAANTAWTYMRLFIVFISPSSCDYSYISLCVCGHGIHGYTYIMCCILFFFNPKDSEFLEDFKALNQALWTSNMISFMLFW